MVGQQKRPLERGVATQPVKYFKHSDACAFDDTEKLLKEHIHIVKEMQEHLDVQKHSSFSVKGNSMQQFLERMTPNWQDRAETVSKTKQLLHSVAYHDETPLWEQQALEGTRPIVERQAQSSLKSVSDTSALHPSHGQSSYSLFTPAQNQPLQLTIAFPEVNNENLQAQYDMHDQLPHKKVPIGSDFQALVPVWKPLCKPGTAATRISYGTFRGEIDTDDAESVGSRWPGLQVWPLAESKNIVSEDQIGRGRSDTCHCVYPQSVGCIQLHIQEENAKLKSMLGKAFQLWGFKDMGESVTQNWTEEEQKQFKALVKSNPASLEKNFWHHLPSSFPNRNTKDFVSYYFNVFVLQQRAIQNRLDRYNIDSDNDECSLTGSDVDESEEYITDVEEEAEYEEGGNEGGVEEETWEYIIEGQAERNSEASSFSEQEIQNDNCVLSKPDASYFVDDESSTGSMEYVSLSTSEEDSSVGLQSVSHSICSPQSISSCHHYVQASEKHCKGSSYVFGEWGCQGGGIWHSDLWEEADHNLQKDSMPILKNYGEIDMIADINGLGSDNHSLFVLRTSPDICDPDIWFEPVNISPRKSLDKFISTSGMIIELFGEGFKEANIDSKCSVQRVFAQMCNSGSANEVN